MQPNENAPQLPANYLDQIATKPQRGPSIFNNRPVMIGAIAIGILFLLCIVGLVINMSAGNIAPNERLAARLVSTKDTVDESTDNIKNTKLRALNSSLNIYLTNTIRDITPILAKNNIKVDKLPGNVSASESNEKMLAILEDARLNVRFDRVYAYEMSVQLDKILILMRQIYKNTRSSSLKAFLETAYKTLEPTQKEFADFNDTTS